MAGKVRDYKKEWRNNRFADEMMYPAVGKITQHQRDRAKRQEESRSLIGYMAKFEKKEREKYGD